jgi:hypothetical protein
MSGYKGGRGKDWSGAERCFVDFEEHFESGGFGGGLKWAVMNLPRCPLKVVECSSISVFTLSMKTMRLSCASVSVFKVDDSKSSRVNCMDREVPTRMGQGFYLLIQF